MEGRGRAYRWGLVLLLLDWAAVLLRADAADNAWVRVLPAAGDQALGRPFTVEVVIEDVANLYGADVRLGFDVGRLQVVDADPGLPGVQVAPRDDLLSPDLVIRNEVDNVGGTVWYAVTQVNPSPPVTGTGALLALTFQAVAVGAAAVEVRHQELSTPQGVLIPSGAAGAVYRILPPRAFLPLVVR